MESTNPLHKWKTLFEATVISYLGADWGGTSELFDHRVIAVHEDELDITSELCEFDEEKGQLDFNQDKLGPTVLAVVKYQFPEW